MHRAVAVLLLPLAAGCAARTRPAAPLPALGAEAEVHVYLQPLPPDAARLAFALGAVAAVGADGALVPLKLELSEISRDDASRQRLLAWGRVPAGAYSALALTFRRASVRGARGPGDLLVPEAPVRVEVPLQLSRGRAAVVRLSLRGGQVQEGSFDFAAGFSAQVLAPENVALERAAFCTRPETGDVVVMDARSRQVAAVYATGREPTGLAVDVLARRAYVALRGEDQVQILDLSSGDELGRIPLRSGDEPADLALAPDRRTLLVASPGSNTVVVADALAAQVLERISVGLEPSVVRLDRDGRRAYVLDRRSGGISVVDVAGRAVARTVPTDPEPVAAQLDRAGTRLYVVHRGSAYVTVLALPDLTVASRIFVGLGASAVEVDPRTALVYVGSADERSVQVFDPLSFAPMAGIELPAPASFLAIDALENALVAVMPAAGQVGYVDIASRRLTSAMDVGPAPDRLVVVGERR